MVVTGIVVASTAIGTSYTGLYFEIGVPSKTTANMGIVVHLETGEEPGTEVGSVQYLLAPHSSSNMHLPFSPS